ncbi:SAM-dependent methyltransferase [Polymorphospora sp. NPDC050346]|uniref:SAM-dependent methyltransferase n=1 Tax=Polymorphospora sp. NPDC050346 TaxID=3155780 RepID=UPI0033C034C0
MRAWPRLVLLERASTPRIVIDRLLAAVPSGSYVAVANTTTAVNGEVTAEAVRAWNTDAQPNLKLRTPERIAEFFTGLETVESG